MSCTKEQLRQRIIRALGGSMIKIELCIEDLDDTINMARDYFITWAVGNATQETYFLLMLKGGQYVYDLPMGVVDVINYHDHFGGMGAGIDGGGCGYNPMWYTGPEQGSTSFFAIQNPGMYGMGYGMAGVGSQTNNGSMTGSPYGYVDAFVARTTMQLIHNLRPDKYQWRYHKITNQLEIIPTPLCGNTLYKTSPSGDVYDTLSASYPCPSGTYETETFDSPGYVLIRSYMIEGCSLPTYTPALSGDTCTLYPDIGTELSEYLWSHPWIYQYAVALCKQRLGYIRRKYASSSVMGGASISLDGDSMYSEGHEDQLRLEEEVDSKYSYEGYGLSMG